MVGKSKSEKPGLIEKIKRNRKKSSEDGSRKKLLEELFYDFNRSRIEIYKMNLVRGLLFGAGSVLGGTVVIALLVWVLSLLGNVFPPLDFFFNDINQTIKSGTE